MDLTSTHYQVLSVFHHASTNNQNGVLVIAQDGQNLVFWWRQYPQMKNGKVVNNAQKNEIVMNSKDIQKYVVNYRVNDPHILIVSKTSMYQFVFPSTSMPNLISFIQMLTIQKCQIREEPPNLEEIVEFAAETFISNETKFTAYDMDVESGNVTIPQEYCTNGLLPKKLFVVQPELNIISEFKIVKEEYTQQPVTLEDLNNIKSLSELKKKVLKYGVHPDIRYLVWPIIMNILPFDKESRDKILKMRVEEYQSIRLQWKSLTKHQIKAFKMIKDAFSTINVDVKRTHPPPGVEVTEEWHQTIVSLLKSFTIWNQDSHYTQGLNDIAANIMLLFARPTCTELEPEVAEALTFWCFAHFVEMAGKLLVTDNMYDEQTAEVKEIYKIIESYSANANWLKAQHMEDLSFLPPSLMLAYGRSFDKSSVARLWETLICVDNHWMFLRYFSASLIIFALQTFMLIRECSSAKLGSMADNIYSKLDLGAMIAVALKMMENDNVSPEIAKKEPALEEGPHTANYKIYFENDLYR